MRSGFLRAGNSATPLSRDDWDVIREIIDTCGLSRWQLAMTICECLGWLRPNGNPKTPECFEWLGVVGELGVLAIESRGFRTIVANCLAHAVRKFRDVEDAFPVECRRVLADLGSIYRIDDQTAGMTPRERLAFHRTHSGPILAGLKSWIDESESRGVEPNSQRSASLPRRALHCIICTVLQTEDRLMAEFLV